MAAIRVFRPDEPAHPPALTVRDVIALYLRHCQVEGVHSPEARTERVRTLGLFAADLGHMAVADAKAFHLSDWIEGHSTWKSVSTRRAKANEVRAAFQWAAIGERIARNPFLSVRYSEAERRPELPDNTLDRIAALANKPYERAVRFLRLTGCRLSELCRAEWPDVDLDKGLWIVHQHKSRKRTGKAKLIALVPDAVELLRELRGLQVTAAVTAGAVGVLLSQTGITDPAGTIFRNNRGTAWTRHTLGQYLRALKKRHGIETAASLHGIRHQMATVAIAAGAPIKLVAAQLGHATVATTERFYCHLGAGQMDAIREAACLGLPKRG